MNSVNNVTISGRLTRDPEARFLSNGNKVANFSVAVNRSYKKDDEWKEEVAFVDCELFGPAVDILVGEYKKGTNVVVIGRLRQDSWERPDGTKTSKLCVSVESFGTLVDKWRDKEKVTSKPLDTKKKPAKVAETVPSVSEDEIPF